MKQQDVSVKQGPKEAAQPSPSVARSSRAGQITFSGEIRSHVGRPDRLQLVGRKKSRSAVDRRGTEPGGAVDWWWRE